MGQISGTRKGSSRLSGTLLRLLAGLLLAASLGGFTLLAPSSSLAAGASFQVTCADGQSGPQGMQAALNAAPSDATPYTITIDQPNCLINLGSPLTIGNGVDITIDGQGLTLDGSNQGHPVDIIDINDSTTAASLTLDRVTLENGNNGVIDLAGGAAVTLTNSTVSDSGNSGDNATGGFGIAAFSGNVSLTNSTVSNSGNGGGFGIYAYTGNISLTSSTVNGSGNSGGYGIEANGGNVSLTDSTVSDSGNDSDGVGVFAQVNVSLISSTVSDSGADGVGVLAEGNVSLTDSTVSDSGNHGSGIDAIGNVSLINSTVSDSGSSGGFGIDALTGNVSLINSTVIGSGNSDGYGIFAYGGNVSLTSSTVSDNGNGGRFGIDANGSITLTASILDNPGTTNCRGATLVDSGYNLATDGTCGFGATSKVVTDAALNLGPLADNGGPTETIALGPGSVAIDAIPVDSQGQCVVGAQVDQRGIMRPQGQGCDIGAFEVAYPLTIQPGSTTTVTHGYSALLRFSPTDAHGNDIASRSLRVTTVVLDGPSGQVIPFAYPFHFTMAHDTPQYQLALNTRNLAPGTWNLEIRISSGSSVNYSWITFTVE